MVREFRMARMRCPARSRACSERVFRLQFSHQVCDFQHILDNMIVYLKERLIAPNNDTTKLQAFAVIIQSTTCFINHL